MNNSIDKKFYYRIQNQSHLPCELENDYWECSEKFFFTVQFLVPMLGHTHLDTEGKRVQTLTIYTETCNYFNHSSAIHFVDSFGIFFEGIHQVSHNTIMTAGQKFGITTSSCKLEIKRRFEINLRV